MRFSFLLALVAMAAAATPSLGAPTTPTSESMEIDVYPLQRPTVPRMKYENLNHIIIRANDAVKRLDKALSDAIKGGEIDASLGPAEKGLGLLAMYLEDAKEGLNNGSVKINNPNQIYSTIKDFRADVKIVAQKVAGLKSTFEQLQFTPIIVTVLQGLTVAFDGFFHALDARLDKSQVPDCIAEPVLDIVCSLDSAISTLDPTATLTDDKFCQKPTKLSTCPAWQQLPKKVPGLEALHYDVRLYLLIVYLRQCFDVDCKQKIEALFIALIVEITPHWKSDERKKQHLLPSH